MKQAIAFFKLGRPLTSLLGGLAVFAASLVGAGTNLGTYWFPVAIGSIVGYVFTSASDALNDYVDRDIDCINHPERPVPSGKISPRAALKFSIVLFGISMTLAVLLILFVGVSVFFVVLAALLVQLTYELKVKKTKVIGNLFIGFQTVLAFLFGGVIVNNLSPVAIMATASFLSITAREVVKDVEDIKGDLNTASLPKIIGIKKANIIALILVCSAIAVSLVAYLPLHIFGIGYFLAVIVADALFIYSMPLLFKNPNAARKMWKYAMMLALIAFIVGGIT